MRRDPIFFADLGYRHSNGDHDTKASYIEKLATGITKYRRYEHTDRKFTSAAPGIALMTARVRIQGRSLSSRELDVYLSVLAVYREEKGAWRFLAWQSARLPLPESPTAKK